MRREDKTVWLRSKMRREDIVEAISEDALEALCREFDIEIGEYPEHDYEGCAIYSYFCWMKNAFGQEASKEETEKFLIKEEDYVGEKKNENNNNTNKG